MESMRCPYGFALYSAALPATTTSFVLGFSNLKDRVQVFVEHAAAAGGETKTAASYSYGGVAYRVNSTSVSFTLPHTVPAGTVVHLLLENMGRINFSHGMDAETKGVGSVTLNGDSFKRWVSRCLAFDYATEVVHAPFVASPLTSAAALTQPTLFRGTFHVDAVADTFVEMRGWSKGAVWINGFALGRYVDVLRANRLTRRASLQRTDSCSTAPLESRHEITLAGTGRLHRHRKRSLSQGRSS
jgi:beta-galactosidase